MKKKKFILPLLLLFPLMSGCNGGDSGSAGSSKEPVSLDTVVNVTKIKRGFIVSTQKAEEEVDYSQYKTLASMSAAGVYYLVYDFDYYSRKTTDGSLVLKASLEFDMVTIFNAMLLESDSGHDGTPIQIRDSETNRIHYRIIQTFRIPEEEGVTKHQQVVFRITPTAVGESKMQMHFETDDEKVRIIGDGAEGCTVPMVVSEYKIERPVVAYDTTLHWPHVAGASYYKIKVSDEFLKDPATGEDLKVVVDEKMSVDAQVYFRDLAKYTYGSNIPIEVQAFGTKVGIAQSDPSETIYINL